MELIDNDNYNWKQEDHRDLLRGMLMTTCDLAAITKPWDVEKRVAISSFMFPIALGSWAITSLFIDTVIVFI